MATTEPGGCGCYSWLQLHLWAEAFGAKPWGVRQALALGRPRGAYGLLEGELPSLRCRHRAGSGCAALPGCLPPWRSTLSSWAPAFGGWAKHLQPLLSETGMDRALHAFWPAWAGMCPVTLLQGSFLGFSKKKWRPKKAVHPTDWSSVWYAPQNSWLTSSHHCRFCFSRWCNWGNLKVAEGFTLLKRRERMGAWTGFVVSSASHLYHWITATATSYIGICISKCYGFLIKA